jgi:putative sterol carrier protein
MSLIAFSPEWAGAFRDAVNADATYRDVGSGWTNPVALVVEAVDPARDGVAVEVDLQAGECVAATSLPSSRVSAPFVLSADAATWKEILDGADPIIAIVRGRVQVTRGALGTLMLHARGAKALVACARTIATAWP